MQILQIIRTTLLIASGQSITAAKTIKCVLRTHSRTPFLVPSGTLVPTTLAVKIMLGINVPASVGVAASDGARVVSRIVGCRSSG